LSVWKKVVKLFKGEQNLRYSNRKSHDMCAGACRGQGAEIRNFMPKSIMASPQRFCPLSASFIQRQMGAQNKKDDKEADDEESTLAGRSGAGY